MGRKRSGGDYETYDKYLQPKKKQKVWVNSLAFSGDVHRSSNFLSFHSAI